MSETLETSAAVAASMAAEKETFFKFESSEEEAWDEEGEGQ
jgi:hypothetical protein